MPARRNQHFVSVASWKEAGAHLNFEPREPARTAGFELQSLDIHVRDHKRRDLPPSGRSLEAHYGGFVLCQSCPGRGQARRRALSVAYGAGARTICIGRCEGRAYDLGPQPAPDDIDGRMPAVVTWHDEDRFYLIASESLSADDLAGIAMSLYP